LILSEFSLVIELEELSGHLGPLSYGFNEDNGVRTTVYRHQDDDLVDFQTIVLFYHVGIRGALHEVGLDLTPGLLFL